MTRKRLDALLAERGLFPSREQARAAVLVGDVKVEGARVTKAGEMVADDAVIDVADRPRFVSRGGVKLAGALDSLQVDVAGVRAVDVGASTGGFTDCLLQRGAESVAAVDVGYGQLAWSLRSDPRVSVFERTNIREVEPASLGTPFDLAVVDVSFISLAKVLPYVLALIGPNGRLVALVKPQFEVGKGRVGKKGVVRDAALHIEVLESAEDAVRAAGWVVTGLTYSPITGPEGNIEFWIVAGVDGTPTTTTPREVVQAAHCELGDR